jgi:hypothetical protein
VSRPRWPDQRTPRASRCAPRQQLPNSCSWMSPPCIPLVPRGDRVPGSCRWAASTARCGCGPTARRPGRWCRYGAAAGLCAGAGGRRCPAGRGGPDGGCRGTVAAAAGERKVGGAAPEVGAGRQARADEWARRQTCWPRCWGTGANTRRCSKARRQARTVSRVGWCAARIVGISLICPGFQGMVCPYVQPCDLQEEIHASCCWPFTWC